MACLLGWYVDPCSRTPQIAKAAVFKLKHTMADALLLQLWKLFIHESRVLPVLGRDRVAVSEEAMINTDHVVGTLDGSPVLLLVRWYHLIIHFIMHKTVSRAWAGVLALWTVCLW